MYEGTTRVVWYYFLYARFFPLCIKDLVTVRNGAARLHVCMYCTLFTALAEYCVLRSSMC